MTGMGGWWGGGGGGSGMGVAKFANVHGAGREGSGVKHGWSGGCIGGAEGVGNGFVLGDKGVELARESVNVLHHTGWAV